MKKNENTLELRGDFWRDNRTRGVWIRLFSDPNPIRARKSRSDQWKNWIRNFFVACILREITIFIQMILSAKKDKTEQTLKNCRI